MAASQQIAVILDAGSGRRCQVRSFAMLVGQIETEDGTFPFYAGDTNITALQVEQLPAYGKAQSCSAVSPGYILSCLGKAVKNMGKAICGDPYARIRYREC